MIDTVQVEHLKREKKPARIPKRHKCPVCLADGHHAKTCPDLLLTTNGERANAFLKRLVERRMVDGYLKSAVNRFGMCFVVEVRKKIEEMVSESLET